MHATSTVIQESDRQLGQDGYTDQSPKNEFVTRSVPNQQLTSEQRQAKKNLKAKLKLESRKRKFQTRYDHALRRNDPKVAQQALCDLEGVLEQEKELLQQLQEHQGDHAVSSTESSESFYQPSLLEQQSRSIIEGVYHQLQRSLQNTTTTLDGDDESASQKEHRTEQARELLRNMTKGTQDLDMFDNAPALRGYVRQKFIERAMLVASSLSKLAQFSVQEEFHQSPKWETHQKLWKRLQSIHKVVSIGCGPGCDGVGIAAWVESQSKHNRNKELNEKLKPMAELVLLDWAMPQWEQIVNPLAKIIAPGLIENVTSGTCDVLRGPESSDNQSALQHCAGADLVITSYLLSETRGRWHSFYDCVMDYCCQGKSSEASEEGPFHGRDGTLFLFSDPTAWQLHEWLHRNRDRLEGWCWLDSSMSNEDLQVLEGRVGPAVLLALTKTHP